MVSYQLEYFDDRFYAVFYLERARLLFPTCVYSTAAEEQVNPSPPGGKRELRHFTTTKNVTRMAIEAVFKDDFEHNILHILYDIN